MSTLSNKFVAICMVTAISMVMYGCGGGGGGSSSTPDPMDGDNGDDTAMMCPDGQVGEYPNCMEPGPTDEELAEIRAEAERVAGMIGPTATLADADTTNTVGTNDPIVSLNTDNMPAFVGDDGDGPLTDFADAMMAPTAIDGASGATYTRTRDMTVDTVVKYNTKEANTAALYTAYFDGNNTRSGVDGAQSGGILTLATDQSMMSPIDADFGITAHSQTITFTDDDMTADTDESAPRIKGTLLGIPGTFGCGTSGANNSCTATSGSMPALMTLSSGWTFTPDGILDMDGAVIADADDLAAALANIMVAGVVPDPDFLIFGYWQRAVTDDMDETTHSYLPFADGTMPYGGDGGTVGSVTGSATYEGTATGLYMSKSLTPQGQPTGPFASGQFTADATLTATFGQTAGGTLSPSHLFTIFGTIDNFMNADGEMINELWSVSLERTLLGAANTGTAFETDGTGDANNFTGVAKAENLAGPDGVYSGTFYGDNADDAMPSSTAGTFDAHFTNGHVRGAYAAD